MTDAEVQEARHTVEQIALKSNRRFRIALIVLGVGLVAVGGSLGYTYHREENTREIVERNTACERDAGSEECQQLKRETDIARSVSDTCIAFRKVDKDHELLDLTKCKGGDIVIETPVQTSATEGGGATSGSEGIGDSQPGRDSPSTHPAQGGSQPKSESPTHESGGGGHPPAGSGGNPEGGSAPPGGGSTGSGEAAQESSSAGPESGSGSQGGSASSGVVGGAVETVNGVVEGAGETVTGATKGAEKIVCSIAAKALGNCP